MDNLKTNKRILVIGDIMLDIYHFGHVGRISPEAPAPVFLETGDIRYVPGGAANVAANIAAIGVSTDLFSVVGNDDEGRCLRKLLDKNDISAVNLFCMPGYRTTSKLRYIAQNNQQIMRADSEDIIEIPLDEVAVRLEWVKKNVKDYGLILLSDYRKGFLSELLVKRVISVANDNGIPVFVDVKDKDFMKYKNATLIKPNRSELSDLTDMPVSTREETADAAIFLCRTLSCQYVLTTLGAAGMMLVDQNGIISEIKSVAREVYDVTGAGDTSIAYLAAETVLGRTIEEAMYIANVAAGIQVGKVGTSIVKPDEVTAAMGKLPAGKVVFTNGCFDIIHAGHIAYLKEARSLGDKLVVGINSDDSVRRLKGKERPINSLADRMDVLSALSYVDEVVPFEEDTPLELIKKVRPDVLVKGGDYIVSEIVGADFVLSYGGTVRTLPFLPGRSTSGIIKKQKGK